jgi:threonine synthase
MAKTFVTHLECSVCGRTHSLKELHTVCTECGKSLLARYDLVAARRGLHKEQLRSSGDGFWKYRPLLPVISDEFVTSLGETTTPVIQVPKTARRLGLPHLWIKDEGHLPTGSFKSRGLALAVSRARELGVTQLCVPSAGNAGGALAAYGARAGLTSHIFMPEDTPAANIVESRAYGSEVVLVPGTISDAAKAMGEMKKTHPFWFDVSTLKEPYRLEGKKTMGYELAEQFRDKLPDVIVYPTGGGTGLIGMWKAFDEMEELGWIGGERPRMISVQSSTCAPIVRAFDSGSERSEFWEGAATVASGLRVPKAFADYMILEALRESGGCAVSVSDDDLLQEALSVAADDGVFLCPEGGAAVAALRVLIGRGDVGPEDRVVVFNTATGLKYLEAFQDYLKRRRTAP